jgi:hypothetical protein
VILFRKIVKLLTFSHSDICRVFIRSYCLNISVSAFVPLVMTLVFFDLFLRGTVYRRQVCAPSNFRGRVPKLMNSPPKSNDEVKNAWSYTSTPQYAFMASCLVKK